MESLLNDFNVHINLTIIIIIKTRNQQQPHRQLHICSLLVRWNVLMKENPNGYYTDNMLLKVDMWYNVLLNEFICTVAKDKSRWRRLKQNEGRFLLCGILALQIIVWCCTYMKHFKFSYVFCRLDFRLGSSNDSSRLFRFKFNCHADLKFVSSVLTAFLLLLNPIVCIICQLTNQRNDT